MCEKAAQPCLASSAASTADLPATPMRLNISWKRHPGPASDSAAAMLRAPSSPTSQRTIVTARRGGSAAPVATAAATAAAPASPIGMNAKERFCSRGATPRRKTPQTASTPRAP